MDGTRGPSSAHRRTRSTLTVARRRPRPRSIRRLRPTKTQEHATQETLLRPHPTPVQVACPPCAARSPAAPDAGGPTSSCFVDNPSQCCSSTVAACCQTAHGPVESCVPAYGLQPLGLLGSQVSCSQEVDGCQRTGTCCQ